MAIRNYVGARYVPKFADPVEWQANTSYEAMVIVTYNNSSYTSKIPVPPTVGNPAENSKYWALTGNYNAQVEEYSKETADAQEHARDGICAVDEGNNTTATKSHKAHEYFWWKGKLYIAKENINAGALLSDDENVKEGNIADGVSANGANIDAIKSDASELVAMFGNLYNRIVSLEDKTITNTSYINGLQTNYTRVETNLTKLISESKVEATFNNVQEMVSNDLSKFNYVETKGFHEPNDGGGGIYKVNVTATANNFNTFKCINSYATLINKVGNVLQLGGTANDITDALKFAIINYNYIEIPNGNYNVSNILINQPMNKFTYINGNNATLNFTSGNLELSGTGASYSKEKILYLYIRDLNLNNGGIVLHKCSHSTINNVYVENANIGIALDSCTELYIIRSHLFNNKIGLSVYQNDLTVDNANNHMLYCSIDNNTTTDVYLNNFRDIHFIGCVIAGQSTAKRITIDSTLKKNNLLVLDNCHIESNGNKIIACNTESKTSIITIKNSLLLTTSEHCINLSNVDKLIMSGNILSYEVKTIIDLNSQTELIVDDTNLFLHLLYSVEPSYLTNKDTANFYPKFNERGSAEFVTNVPNTFNTDHVTINSTGVLEFDNVPAGTYALVIASNITTSFQNYYYTQQIYKDPNGEKNYFIISTTVDYVIINFPANSNVYGIYVFYKKITPLPVLRYVSNNPFKEGDIFINNTAGINAKLIARKSNSWKNLLE